MRRRVIVEKSDRLYHLAPDLADQFDRIHKRTEAKGLRVVDLSREKPLAELEEGLTEEVLRAGREPDAALPGPVSGHIALRRAVARWYSTAEGVSLDPDTQVVVAPSGEAAIQQLALALLGPDDRACTFDPADPLHHAATVMAGCPSIRLPLAPHNGFQPDFAALPTETAERLKLLILGYPHIPTAAVASPDTFPTAIQLARRYNIIVCHDARLAYAFFGERPRTGFLGERGAVGVGVEILEIPPPPVPSPWRLAVVVGDSDVLACLTAAMRATGATPSTVIQLAAASALYREEQRRRSCTRVLRDRRDAFVQGLKTLGWQVSTPDATPFLWLGVPPGYSSVRFASLLLRRARVRSVPGIQFGANGEGYVQLCFAVTQEDIRTALAGFGELLAERPRLRRQLRPRTPRRRRRKTLG